ncbi:hypothetical protein [Glaciecola sp. 1036]|uniref:hypothetical protein n=1 Tax=Alteromonadaceae TaxID=72275 RepID=UPI003D0688B3
MSEHLSDEELLDDEIVKQAHFITCEQCQHRWKIRKKIQLELQSFNSLHAPAFEFTNVATTSRESTWQQNKSWFFRSLVFATAASVFTIIAISTWRLTDPKNGSIDLNTGLKQAIDENNRLISQYQQQVNPASGMLSLLQQSRLDDIEQQLQQAYLNNATDQRKLELWEQRFALLKQLEKTPTFNPPKAI